MGWRLGLGGWVWWCVRGGWGCGLGWLGVGWRLVVLPTSLGFFLVLIHHDARAGRATAGVVEKAFRKNHFLVSICVVNDWFLDDFASGEK